MDQIDEAYERMLSGDVKFRFEAIDDALPAARVHGIAAGLDLLLELPPGVEEAQVVERAAAGGVRVPGLADFTRAHPGPPALVLGYGLPSVRELREAVAVITSACEDGPET